jgi:probable rRNA maturation factor
MITIRNTQRTMHIKATTLKKTAQAMLKYLGYADFDLGIWLTTNKTIRHYNKTFRGKDKPTDILSFPYHEQLKPGEKILVREPEDKNLGDIIISLEYVRKDAIERWQRDFDEHMIILLAHGIAHLLNYDHINDNDFAVMQKIESKLIKAGKKISFR